MTIGIRKGQVDLSAFLRSRKACFDLIKVHYPDRRTQVDAGTRAFLKSVSRSVRRWSRSLDRFANLLDGRISARVAIGLKSDCPGADEVLPVRFSILIVICSLVVTLAFIALARLPVFADAGITAIHSISAELASFQPAIASIVRCICFYLIA